MPQSALPPFVATLRQHDRPRYQTALFAPPERRAALFALYAFNFEIARTREAAREPLLGRVRLQWWRETIGEIYAGGKPRRHDVAEALAAAIRDHGLSRNSFDALLNARETDLSDDPPPTLASLEAYTEDSSARLVRLALEALGAKDESAIKAGRAVGIAYGLAGLLAAVPFHARMKRVFLPADLIERHGLDIERTLFELKPSPALAKIVADVAACAQTRLGEGRALRTAVPREALPALMPAVVAARRLKLLDQLQRNVFDARWSRPDPLQSWRLAWAALRRSY